MATMILIDQNGPLPLSAAFNVPSDGEITFLLSGTARTTNAAVLTGIVLSLDGNQIGSPAMCWANQNNNHIAMRTTAIVASGLSEGSHTVEITPMDGNTTTDVNDYFQLSLWY